MRVPIFRVVCDDDPTAKPFAVSLQTLYEQSKDGDPTFDQVYTNVNPPCWTPCFVPLERGCSVTVGGGAGVQFTLTRIR